MTVSAIQDYSTTAASNTDIGGISCAEGCPSSNVNDWTRELLAQLKKAIANQGTNIASSSSTDLGAATGQYVKITGTTTVNSLGTAAAGTTRDVEFTGALTLTHNATSLILPNAVNKLTVAGDCARFVSEGSGNWRCINYFPANWAREHITIACSDETTPVTTGTAKVTFRMPYAFTLTELPRANVTTAPTGSVLTIDINESGSTILSTKLTIDAGEKTSTSAVTPAVLSDTSLADDAQITIDFDGVGSTVAGAGVKVTLIGRPA